MIDSKKNPGEPKSKVYLLSGGKQFPGEPLNKGNLAAETKFRKILKEINSNPQKIPQEDPLIQNHERLTTLDTKPITIKTKRWKCVG